MQESYNNTGVLLGSPVSGVELDMIQNKEVKHHYIRKTFGRL